jgi:uncharacterized protein (DUF2126 family)
LLLPEAVAVFQAQEGISAVFQELAGARLGPLLEGTYTQACRDKVVTAFQDHVTRFVQERHFPFQDVSFTSQCPPKPSVLSTRSRKPPRRGKAAAREEEGPIIRIAYLLLVHERPEQAARLIEALQDERQHHFVVHVDAKAPPQVRLGLEAVVRNATNVHLMEASQCVSVTW